MKFLVVFSMCVLAVSGAALEVELDFLSGPVSAEEERLINSILTADFDTAFAQTLQLQRQSKENIIEDAVTKLVRGSKRNVLDYAYKLWFGEAKEIVKNHFPVQFRQILSESVVKIISKRDNLAIKLGQDLDAEKDRIAYGDANDKTSENVSWKFVPLWDNNRVYFKIVSVFRHQSLKVGTDADSQGDHGTYGDDVADTHRHQWFLKPANLEGDVLFYIFNRKFNQALKLGRAVDSDGDRIVYSHYGNVDGQPELYGWHISEFN